MSSQAIIMIIALAGLAGEVVLAWWSQVKWTRTLDRWGELYGVRRWDGESNKHFRERIYDRIDITGGRRNPWR